MKKTVRAFFIGFILMLICMSCVNAVSITYQDVIDESINGQKIAQYDVELNAPFSKENTLSTNVLSTQTIPQGF